MTEAHPDWFWLDGADPRIDDDLMEQWLTAVIDRRDLTGPKIAATLEKLVAHLSGGKREVVLCAKQADANNFTPRDETAV